MTDRNHIRALCEIAFVVLAYTAGVVGCTMWLSGCGGPPAPAADITRTYGRVMMSIDQETADIARRTSEHAIEYASTEVAPADQLDFYEQRMRPFWAITEALKTAKRYAEALRDALESWDAGGAEDWQRAAVCAWSAGMRVVENLHPAGVDPPRELLDLLRLIATLGLGECHEDG